MRTQLDFDFKKASSRKIANALNWAGVRLHELSQEDMDRVMELAQEIGDRVHARVNGGS